jgi:ABC-type transporter Mla subunit MlaD
MSDITIRIPEKVAKSVGGLLIGIGLFAILIHLWSSGFFLKKFQLKMSVPDASGLRVGAPVLMQGAQVGSVKSIKLAEAQADNASRVEVTLALYERKHDKIRDTSHGVLIPAGLSGRRYVSNRPGLNGAPIPSGGELAVIPTIQLDSKQFMESFGDLLKCLSREEQQKQGGAVPKTPSGSCPK